MKNCHEMRVGIASPKEMKERLLAAARGEGPPATHEAKVWMAPEALLRLLRSGHHTAPRKRLNGMRWAMKGWHTGGPYTPPPMVPLRSRRFASKKRFRRQALSRVWFNFGKRREVRFRGFRLFVSQRYKFGGRL